MEQKLYVLLIKLVSLFSRTFVKEEHTSEV